jgi:hypothetical protein
MGKLMFNLFAMLALVGVAFALLSARGFTVTSLWNRFMPATGSTPILCAGVLLVFVLVAVFK